MLFNSLSYAIFLPLVCLAYFCTPQRWRWAVLLGFSYYFYMSWNPELIVLILFTTVVSWGAALLLERCPKPKLRRTIVAASCGVCLAVLFFFKYFNFFSQSVHDFFVLFGMSVSPPLLDLLLPVGISFYTFQTLSYVLDVYHGRMKAERHLGYYALYVSFFPQLVAGPIERADRLLPQLKAVHHFDTARFSSGMRKLIVGMFKKVVIADFFSTYVNIVYGAPGEVGGLTVIGATVLFSVQIYCDFSGYSEIAVGSAELLGIRLMDNFKSPYVAKSAQDFWRRWHISLSTWFSDYIYIPLGGSRCERMKHFRNLLITFACSGLWHGAKWTFVLWGLYWGVLLCIESLYRKPLESLQQRGKGTPWGTLLLVVRTLFTYGLACFGWMIFRSDSLADLICFVRSLPRGLNLLRLTEYMAGAGLSVGAQVWAVILLVLFFAYDWYAAYRFSPLEKLERAKPWQRMVVYYAVCFTILLVLTRRPWGTQADFIYFQF